MPDELRVRLDPLIRERLDHFCRMSRRSLTNAVNMLLDDALTEWDTDEGLDEHYRPRTRPKPDPNRGTERSP